MSQKIDRQWLARQIEELDLPAAEESLCPYLGNLGLQSRNVGFAIDSLPEGMYQALMDLGFRRSGDVIYKPQCRACSACQQVRIPVAEYRPNRSQQRCLKKNGDLSVEVGIPFLSDEKVELYSRYRNLRHDGLQDPDTPSDLERFLYSSPIETFEVEFRYERRLLAVGIFDRDSEAISTVYCYFDPEIKGRSLGTYNILWMLNYCLLEKLRYVYLGYYIEKCRKMNYKTKFLPVEVLRGVDQWQRLEKRSLSFSN